MPMDTRPTHTAPEDIMIDSHVLLAIGSMRDAMHYLNMAPARFSDATNNDSAYSTLQTAFSRLVAECMPKEWHYPIYDMMMGGMTAVAAVRHQTIQDEHLAHELNSEHVSLRKVRVGDVLWQNGSMYPWVVIGPCYTEINTDTWRGMTFISCRPAGTQHGECMIPLTEFA